MNLDELIAGLERISTDPALLSVIGRLRDWKSDESNVVDLERAVERLFGHSWIRDDADHRQAYAQWSDFRIRAIAGIGGMTMNERLYAFALFERFDGCTSDADRRAICAKLLAEK